MPDSWQLVETVTIREQCAEVGKGGGLVTAVCEAFTLDWTTWDVVPYEDGFYFIADAVGNVYVDQRWFHGQASMDGEKLTVAWRDRYIVTLELLRNTKGPDGYAAAVKEHAMIVAARSPKEAEYRADQLADAKKSKNS